jgi:fatty-acyl-CoA synthase
MVTALEDAKAAAKPMDLSHLRILLSSGVMWSAPVKAALREHLPTVTMVDSLGASEVTNAGTSVDRPGGKARTARFTLSSVSAVFTEDGRRVTPGSGERGLLCTGGPLPLGYYKHPEKTAATYRTFEGQRWAVPGDWATVEEDATITLLGRGSGCINTGGEKVYPEEVEEVLKLQEEIADCNVVGVADDRFGQRIVAVVAVNSAISDDEIIASARTHLAGYKVPREIIRVEQVLRGPNGKADYRWAQRMAEGVV